MEIVTHSCVSDIDPRPVPQVLEVGSLVQFGNPVQYGVIELIRKDPYNNVEIAEIATVSMYCRLGSYT